ncbi:MULTISPECIES: hypothetical protein [unclassified Chryseobacterium]|uniref:hypothetical protein n=1 Tax=unclassified Chryseobacterium TaxID=2593645 RepID=UPI00092458A0|nr:MULTISPECIES: hypothetical protein [unclassified Chryseobacterium]SHG23989.1 hypothetical protein SAMN02787100_3548 [Chryseobacterium sp. OV279]HCA08927.1 hypothetical protein [Chryseobacterium sp.]
MKIQYNDLPGKTKKEVIELLGDEFNFYPDNIWIYLLHRNFFGRKTYLVIYFENNTATHMKIRKTYGSIIKN